MHAIQNLLLPLYSSHFLINPTTFSSLTIFHAAETITEKAEDRVHVDEVCDVNRVKLASKSVQS